MRELAVKILIDVLKKKTFFEKTSDAFLNMLLLTAFRRLTFIKKQLKSFIKNKPSPIAEAALVLGAVEILYLNSPDYAVLNEYVSIVKKSENAHISGFVNAVLRKISANKEQILKQDQGEFFSPEFLKILKQDYDPKAIAQIEQTCLKEPPLDLSIKPECKLEGLKLDNQTIRIYEKAKVPELKGYKEGLFWVQDFAASQAVKMLGGIKGKTALDLCAAPGGKTAQLIQNGAATTALDISEDRLKTLKENLNRLQMKAEKIICADAVEYLKTAKDKYDIVLLDAPCSATGTIRRHPELVHIKTLSDIKQQAKIQTELLSLSGNVLNSGGILLYAVCSLSKFEGERQIKNLKGYKLLEQKRILPHQIIPVSKLEFLSQMKEDPARKSGVYTSVHEHLSTGSDRTVGSKNQFRDRYIEGGQDGFYIAKLEKE